MVANLVGVLKWRLPKFFVLESNAMSRLSADVVDFVSLGFHVSDAPTNRMARPHRHNEIEITVLERGWVDYLFGGQPVRIPAGVFCVRWAAIPHQSLDFDPGGIHYSLKVPLAWFLNWRLPDLLVNRLLAGELLMDEECDPGCSDFAMLRRWFEAFCSNSPSRHRVILLEAEARLLRLAAQLPPLNESSSRTAAKGHLGKVERMTVFVAENYTRDIGITEIASAGGLHPNSAMRAFRKTCGLTLLEYLTMHRIWHAQQLLAATNMKIRVIAETCGFSSASRFYAAFERMVGQRPRDYRDSIRGQTKTQPKE
jgi:AraC-like DNA-binding protein